MRWLYLDPTNREEAAYRAETLRKIDHWWRQFQAKTRDLEELFARRSEWDLPSWMADHLQAIDPQLMWEYGPAVRQPGHRLVITPEAERWLRPLVQTLVERAPRVTGWEFYDYRLAESVEQAQMSVHGRTGGDLAQMRVELRIGQARKIDLLYCSPYCSDGDNQQARSAAFVATESLLGEQTLDLWIGEIEVAPPPKSGLLSAFRRQNRRVDAARLLPLERLKPTVDALIGSMLEQLPDAPCYTFIRDTPWTSYTIKPQENDDYPARDDMYVGVTGRPDVFETAHSAGIFHSGCFSRHGETFCYVKIDGSQGLADSRFADRAAIEDALHDALVAEKLGGAIGGGTGVRYSYVDLALLNLPRGIQVIREILQRGNIPRRTWLLFFDDELAREWIGIYDDTPAPPM
jgi:hypothetical protein